MTKIQGKKRKKLRAELEKLETSHNQLCQSYIGGRYSDSAVYYINKKKIESLKKLLAE